MAATLETVAQQALDLPLSGRAILLEKLLASLAGETSAEVERTHLDEIRLRRDAVCAGKGSLIDGKRGLREVRAALKK